MARTIRIATRKSALALWQAHHVAGKLESAHPGIRVEFLPLVTRGDRILDQPLAKIGGKGLFLKELERALLDGEADLAVHSMKDVPVQMTPGLAVAAVLERASPGDAWLSRSKLGIDELAPGCSVGTSSLRRQCQLLARRPDLRVLSLRGNVDTRVRKLEAGDYDAILLAVAGLQRLGLDGRIDAELNAPDWLPAPCQGAIGIQCRSNDEHIGSLVRDLNHSGTEIQVQAEQALSRRLGGSCQLPLAAFAQIDERNQITLHALVGSADGKSVLRASATAPEADAETVAEQAAAALLAQGAEAIIRAELSGAEH
ncbi:MAG: hydroxymethylbilane synthase [Xanthomonadales bacterium]|nr:hydroxymethylbilane synthase [Xanthomonadales bacterium]